MGKEAKDGFCTGGQILGGDLLSQSNRVHLRCRMVIFRRLCLEDDGSLILRTYKEPYTKSSHGAIRSCVNYGVPCIRMDGNIQNQPLVGSRAHWYGI